MPVDPQALRSFPPRVRPQKPSKQRATEAPPWYSVVGAQNSQSAAWFFCGVLDARQPDGNRLAAHKARTIAGYTNR